MALFPVQVKVNCGDAFGEEGLLVVVGPRGGSAEKLEDRGKKKRRATRRLCFGGPA
jgi:hypothetical protein